MLLHCLMQYYPYSMNSMINSRMKWSRSSQQMHFLTVQTLLIGRNFGYWYYIRLLPDAIDTFYLFPSRLLFLLCKEATQWTLLAQPRNVPICGNDQTVLIFETLTQSIRSLTMSVEGVTQSNSSLKPFYAIHRWFVEFLCCWLCFCCASIILLYYS